MLYMLGQTRRTLLFSGFLLCMAGKVQDLAGFRQRFQKRQDGLSVGLVQIHKGIVQDQKGLFLRKQGIRQSKTHGKLRKISLPFA